VLAAVSTSLTDEHPRVNYGYACRVANQEPEPQRVAPTACGPVHHIFTTSEGQPGFVTVARGASNLVPDLGRCANVLVSDGSAITFAT